MLVERLAATRDLGRLQEIASILIRHGFGDVVRRLGLGRLLRRAGSVLPTGGLEALVELPAPVRVRCALEQMGPTFVKLGQVLATRVDLFPPDWIAEFGKLQNQVPAVPWEQVHAALVAALGTGPDEAFARFERKPLAAASIAQVHRAVLHDGSEVVVKIRRPGIRRVVEADMRLLQRGARALETHLPELRQFQPRAMVRQFRASLARELDLAAECRHAERIVADLADCTDLVVPRVHWEFTSEQVNVQDFLDGIGVGEVEALDAAGLDRRLLARRGARMVLRMMFSTGLFHADPHPGNVLVLPDNRIGLIDFGMVGRLGDQRRAEVVALLDALVRRDAERVADLLLDWSRRPGEGEELLLQDVDNLLDRFHGVPLGQLDLSAMLLDVTALLRANQLVLPADLALLVKVFVTLEGLGRKLDPDFDMAAEAEPFLRDAMTRQYSPVRLAREGMRAMGDTARLLASLPRDLRRLVRSARAGSLKLHVDIDHLQRFGAQVEHSANRLTVGVVLAALIVGSSIALTVKGGPTLLGLPLFGLLGFVGAAIAGAWLVFSIWRSGGGK
ncbi:AarF/UbiB family protein [Lysobacter sp. GX 14042]|uniref:ABC1 kinase family protein n=1 Tax=Lysobacter sp. GX 14042 TaxID=2907155 RepID=UPI001F24D1C4|nr:AarF/UbiB family protein [Lysobacter sp. GX 14042]MCE7032966.1 AarF/UbiB family protein [Lysobacter sp. GX 14042]